MVNAILIKRTYDGQLIKEYTIACGTDNIEPLTFDGQYFYVGDAAGDIYKLDLINSVSVRTYSITDVPARGLCFDGQFLWGIFGSNTLRKTLKKWDVVTGAVIKNSILGTAEWNDLAFDGQYLYLINDNEDLLYKVDPVSLKTIKTISISDASRGICWDGQYLNIRVNPAGGGTVEKRTINGTLISSFSIALVANIAGGLTNDGQYLYTMRFGS